MNIGLELAVKEVSALVSPLPQHLMYSCLEQNTNFWMEDHILP